MRFTVRIALGATVVVSLANAQHELVPAGSINSVHGYPNIAVVYEDHPICARQARLCQESFWPDAKLLAAADAVAMDLSGHNIVVYGTVDGNEWLAKYRNSLPFRYDAGSVRVDREYEGRHLRVISSLINPQDSERRCILYTAALVEDIAGINSVFHGPTEFVVTDGRDVLGSGMYPRAALSQAAMAEDLEVLIDKMLAVHPATVSGPGDEVAAAIERARDGVKQPMTQERFWMVCHRLLLALHDGHTSMSPPPSNRRLQLPVDWLADGIVVTHDVGDLRRGDRVVTIGGRDEATLLAALRDWVPAENDHWVRARGVSCLCDVGILRAAGIAEDVPVPVVVRRGDDTVTASVTEGTLPSEQPRDWVRFAVDEAHDLAVLTIDRCAVDDHYLGRLREFFTAVQERGIGRIAIDVRANSGGNSRVCDELIRYLDVDEYLNYGGSVRLSKDAIEQRGYPAEAGFAEYEPSRCQNARHEDIEPFGGRVYVITGKQTFSSGRWIAVVLADNGLAEVVGEAAGGEATAYGDVLRFELPNSGLEFWMSHKRWVRPRPESEAKPRVDHLVPYTCEDFVRGRDPAVEYLWQLER